MVKKAANKKYASKKQYKRQIKPKKLLNPPKTEKKIKKINENKTTLKLISKLTTDSYAEHNSNSFCIFKSIIDNKLYMLYYSKKSESIIVYDMLSNKKIKSLEQESNVIFFRHYNDTLDKRDLILAYNEEALQIFDAKSWNCIHTYTREDTGGENELSIASASFLNFKNNIYILTSFWDFDYYYEKIKVYDLKGKKIKEINDSDDNTCFIDTYYQKNNNKVFIIVGNYGYCSSYDFGKNILYKKYEDEGFQERERKHESHHTHNNVLIDDKDKNIKLISCSKEFVRIWDFDTAKLLKIIKVGECNINCIGFWKDDCIFTGDEEGKIKILKLIEEKTTMILSGHSSGVIFIEKIEHPKFGDCLVSQGVDEDGQIILWGQ